MYVNLYTDLYVLMGTVLSSWTNP